MALKKTVTYFQIILLIGCMTQHIFFFYTLYMWCVITLLNCRWLYGCNTIHGHNTDISVVGHIKEKNVNYYCNGPKDGPVGGLKHLV